MRMLFILLASVRVACAQGWTGWHPTAWTNERLTTAENVTMCAVSNGPFVVTNHIGGVAIVSTQWFFSDIYFGQPCSTSPVANVWAFSLVNSSGAEYVDTRGWTGTTQAVTMKAQARDVWAIDCYLAMLERWQVAQNTSAVEKPRFYRSNREALQEVKRWLVANMGQYVDLSWEYPDELTNSVPIIGESLLAGLTGSPSNWTAHTPYRYLSPVAVGGLSNVVSGYWTLTGQQDTNGVWLVQTNEFIDSCGNVTTNAGAWTNGQQIAFTCTNSAIHAGRDESEYGWKYARAAFSNLVLARYEAGYSSVETYETGDETYPVGVDVDDPSWWPLYAAVWDNHLTGWPMATDGVQTGFFGGARVSMGIGPDAGNTARLTWSQRFTTGQRPAIPLPKTNAVIVSASEVIGYRLNPSDIACDPPPSDPCDIPAGPYISGMTYTDASGCWTNSNLRRTSISTGYTATNGVYDAGSNPYPGGNVLSFGLPSDPPQPPYSATQMPEIGIRPACEGAEWYQISASGQVVDEMPIIFVRWNFERK